MEDLSFGFLMGGLILSMGISSLFVIDKILTLTRWKNTELKEK